MANEHSHPRSPAGPLVLRLHKRQFQVINSKKRFRVLVAGRRFGKTEIAIAEILKAALAAPNRLIWYIGPTHHLAKSIMWHRLKMATKPRWAKRPSESELRIELTNGSIILVKSAFEPDRLRGEGLDFVVLDEVADLKPQTWTQAIRPSLSDRQGRALFIGTPQGRNHLYDYFSLAESNADWESFHFTTEEGGLVEKHEIENAAREMDTNSFRQEFAAEFTSAGKHRVYVAFTRQANVCEVSFDPDQPIIWALDFNVDPMCMLLLQQIGEHIRVLEEIVVRPDATTEKACRIVLARLLHYYPITSRWFLPLRVKIYGDATANQRRTAASSTDITQIRDFFRPVSDQLRISTYFATMNPLVRDRVNCVNARLRNSLGENRLFISPGCKELIRDLEEVSWATDTAGAPIYEIDKSDPKRTHMSDALGYAISQLFPLKVPGQC